ncbi:Mur ligase family protein [Gammaproteobacteria bacterium]|nr:Mur ligase family protein [Gammaproteobacteria bacterium]
MRSLIFGYGITGQSFARYLLKSSIDFDIYDQSSVDHPNAFTALPDRKKLESYQAVYMSPGVNLRKLYPNNELKNFLYLTDLDVFFQEDHSYKIGVTGTNGKSTCCMHLGQLIENSQILGNFGIPLLDKINSGKQYSIIELSSFQLEKMQQNFLDYGVLLNLRSDHLDHHGTLQNYHNAKKRILQSKKSSTNNDPFFIYHEIMGKPYQGALSYEHLVNLPHRLEVCQLGNGMKIINDSKSTNLDSLQYALTNLPKSAYHHLIIMGDPAKEQYTNLKIAGPSNVFICGKYSDLLAKKVSHPNKLIFCSLGDVLQHIKSLNHKSGILFSPGHPSGEDFKNFEVRGDYFKSLAKDTFDG